MKDLKINDQVKYIFKEAIIDFDIAIAHGELKALELKQKYEVFIEKGFVPFTELAFLYEYYVKNYEQVYSHPEKDKLTDLLSEFRYMINFLESSYSFDLLDGACVVKEKEGEL